MPGSVQYLIGAATVPGGNAEAFSWRPSGGASLLDLSDPVYPKLKQGGSYVLAVEVHCDDQTVDGDAEFTVTGSGRAFLRATFGLDVTTQPGDIGAGATPSSPWQPVAGDTIWATLHTTAVDQHSFGANAALLKVSP